ncbi:hypothetical protein M758_6G164100 [Ceratodon purpureus]|nr:hypothetical protein M758_6G164100 [Ceratodon purpureus]
MFDIDKGPSRVMNNVIQLETRVGNNQQMAQSNSKEAFDMLMIAVSKEVSEMFSTDICLEMGDRALDAIENRAEIYPQIIESSAQKSAPAKKSRLEVLLKDQELLSIYKRFFVLSFIINIVLFILAALGHFNYAHNNAALFALGNVLLLALVRNEIFLRLTYETTVQLFGHSIVPLRLKLWITHGLQNLGGIHAGCGTASIVWSIYAVVELFVHRATVPTPPIAILFVVIFMLLISCLAAVPVLRHVHHNVFENTHRICGWFALALIWCFILLLASYDPSRNVYDFSSHGRHRLVNRLDIWFAAVLTLLVFLPWALIKKVPVRTWISPDQSLSLITFADGLPVGTFARIARNPLKEWHAFGAASDGFSENTLICGAVGDFTKGLVSHPPSHIWTRRVRFAGVTYLANLYTRAVFVATGSGLGPFLSFLMQPTRVDCHLIFIAKNVEQIYGPYITNILSRFPQEKLIVHDTAILGRPNLAKLVVDRVKKCEAEVVIVTSNPAGSKTVIDGCRAAGIPAFGPIWDS